MTGQRDDALRVVAQIAERFVPSPAVPYLLAEVHAGLSDHDRTVAVLRVALERRIASVVLRVLVEPKFDLPSRAEREGTVGRGRFRRAHLGDSSAPLRG